MKLEVFDYLIAIEKYGSLNQAAEHLFVSQPNLTNIIRSLESELGYPVLSRNHRGVQFTERGKQVLLIAHNILREREKLAEVGRVNRSLSLKISIGNCDEILDELCADTAKTEAGDEIDLTILNLPVMEALENVYRQTIDLACMIVPTDMDRAIRDYAESHGLQTFFYPELLCQISLRKNHPLLKAGFSKEGLWNYPFVDFIDQYPEAYGPYRQSINPKKVIRVDHYSLRSKIVAATDAYSIGIYRPGANTRGLVSIPTPDLKMHLVEIRREADQNNAVFNSLRKRLESRLA